jgi:riboflavin kinase/FMN adenylyltransferase
MAEPLSFTARVVSGAGRGKGMGTPTLNVDLSDVPSVLQEGIYACSVVFDGESQKKVGAMHYGPRPVFHDSTSCEIYVLDELIENTPTSLTIEVYDRLRDVADFESPEALQQQIEEDIRNIRAIMSA